MENKSRFSFLMDDDNNGKQQASKPAAEGAIVASQDSIKPQSNRWSLLSDIDEPINKQDDVTGNSPKPNTGTEEETKQFEKSELLKYRSEQLTLTKVNGVIENHAETKLEFHIKRYVSDGLYMVDIHIADNVLNIYPEQLQEALNLVIDVDNVKCNSVVIIDNKTGKIKAIANLDDIKQRWNIQKQKIRERYAFLKNQEAKDNLEAFFTQSDELMTEANIIQDYAIRPFFEVFFDRYLVSKEISLAPYTRQYYSQLFDRIPVQLSVEQKAVHESPVGVEVIKSASLSGNQQDRLKQIEELYNQKYKNGIGYKFSEYVYEHNISTTINIDTNILESASMTFKEAVTNNIEITADYKLRRIQ